MPSKNTEIDKPKQQGSIINNINRLIASSLLPDVFKAISSELKHLIGFDQMNIVLLSEKNEGFELLEFTRDYESSRFKEGTYFRKEGSLWAEVVRTRKPIILKDTKKDKHWSGSTLLKEGIRSRLAFPLEYKCRVVGIINMESGRASSFSEEQFGLIEQIAPQLAIAVENAILLKRISTSLEETKRYVERLEKTNKELTETQTQLIHSARLASVGQLAAGIVHQVNSPLGAISGRIQMLIDKPDSFDKSSLHEHLSKIANDCTRVTNIINDLLDFSRKARPTKGPVNVNPLLEDALGMTVHSLISKKILVKKTLDSNLPPILGIADDLTHVFINIITNAIDAMEENGKLEIRSKFVKDAEKLSKPMVEVSIKDDGHGITEKDKQRIFEPFFTTKDAGKGLGLGLTIAKRILDFHNAQIELISKESEGTTFFIYLPLVK